MRSAAARKPPSSLKVSSTISVSILAASLFSTGTVLDLAHEGADAAHHDIGRIELKPVARALHHRMGNMGAQAIEGCFIVGGFAGQDEDWAFPAVKGDFRIPLGEGLAEAQPSRRRNRTAIGEDAVADRFVAAGDRR